MSTFTNFMHFESSVTREKMLLHIFLADVYKWFWLKNTRKSENIQSHDRKTQEIEILFSEVDNAGYDIVFILGPHKRFIQLKSKIDSSKGKLIPVNAKLAEKNTGDRSSVGCIVLIEVAAKDLSVKYGYFEIPNDLSSFKDAKRPKTPTTRKNTKLVSTRNFESFSNVAGLLKRVFPAIST